LLLRGLSRSAACLIRSVASVIAYGPWRIATSSSSSAFLTSSRAYLMCS